MSEGEEAPPKNTVIHTNDDEPKQKGKKVKELCIVCYDEFNKSTRAETKCPYCDTKICRTCLQTYLLNDINDTPICVNPSCKNGWDRDFLDGEFTRTFRLQTYKDHREKVLADREKARLPATQADATALKEAQHHIESSAKTLTDLHRELSRIQSEINTLEHTRYLARTVVDSWGRRRMTDAAARKEREAPAAFIKPCPAEGCKGFLSTAWKCGLCNNWTCPECHDLKGQNKDVEHTCDPAKVATAQLLAKESKNCPKCGVSICKISGCDQMWCTQCNTAFNWRTGRVAEGPVHNPHYFAWLRSQGRDPASAAGAGGAIVPGNCDADLDRQVMRALYPDNNGGYYGGYGYGYRYGRQRNPPDTDMAYLQEAWRLMREAQDENGREPDMNEKFRQLRVRYMVNHINEEEWKFQLQRIEKDVNFQRAQRQVREVFVGAVRDLVRQVLEPSHNKAELRKQVAELIEYCNKSYMDISKRFGRKTPVIEIKLGS